MVTMSMKRWLLSFLALVVAACTSTRQDRPGGGGAQPVAGTDAPQAASTSAVPAGVRADLADFGPAPELENEVWLNTDQPLRLADLRGQVVLIDMWTFG